MNMCVDFARHKHAQPQTQSMVDEEENERPMPDTAPTPEEHLENRELGRELAAALEEISEEHRRIVLLRDVSGMSYTEIAEVLEDQRRHGQVSAFACAYCAAQGFAAQREPFSVCRV